MKEIIRFGESEQGAIDQAERCLNEADAFVLMADNHKGYGMPVGGVAVYKGKICPAGVGFDIACGNKAIKTNLKRADLPEDLNAIADRIFSELSFGIGRKNEIKVEDSLFSDTAWDSVPFFKDDPELKKKAQSQLGTIGSGNHYVDVFEDEEGFIWVGVHFGSRGLGHTIASHFMKLAGDNVNIMDETPHTLDADSQEGRDYITAMTLAGRYAYAGRDWVCQTVANILGGEIMDEVHNHHNFAWKEIHNGEEYWVVRKGATPAFPGQRGFVGGSMGEVSVILKGIDGDMSRSSFYSTVHGAGRVMSRTQAAGKKKKKKVERTRPDGTTYLWTEWTQEGGLVDFGAVKERMLKDGIILRGAGADEAPEVYKRLPDVLKYHEGTIKVLHTLKPLIVCMAGGDEFDPYKD
jgi:tRNA-splicing ligase RtcB